MTVHMEDGTTLEISEGDVFDIPPGHDAEERRRAVRPTRLRWVQDVRKAAV